VRAPAIQIVEHIERYRQNYPLFNIFSFPDTELHQTATLFRGPT